MGSVIWSHECPAEFYDTRDSWTVYDCKRVSNGIVYMWENDYQWKRQWGPCSSDANYGVDNVLKVGQS